MNSDKLTITFGALLHDIGKVVYRGSSEAGSHSRLGAQFLEETLPDDIPFKAELVMQARYHHAEEIKNAHIDGDSPAYVTYFADNISAGMDRRKEADGFGFDPNLKLRRVFNILNGHNDDNAIEHENYDAIRESIKRELSAPNAWDAKRVGSLLNVLEAKCASVPSSTSTKELADISLFDHMKTTAAIAACLYDWLEEQGTNDYRTALFNFEASNSYYEEHAFLLWSCDISGIQNFIYQISGSKALKQLRARSFYLEVLLEHCMDEMLERLELTRCNLLYTGGGHAYVLLPNTHAARETLDIFADELNAWLLDHFETDLYCACAYAPCSANDLMNREGAEVGKERYVGLYAKVAEGLSAKKANRYIAADIAKLNFADVAHHDHTRECKECHRSSVKLIGEGNDTLCPLCKALRDISAKLIEKDVFVVSGSGLLELPFGVWLSLYGRKEYLDQKPASKRVYTKDWDAGENIGTHLWMGDYTAYQHNNGISDYAGDGITLASGKGGETLGIRRLGVLRADVDDLGRVFSQGFPPDKASISRTSTLSRSLSYFFKHKLNEILEAGKYRVQIIYSGGDDIFLIGNWLDTIYAALDIRKALDAFTGNGTLTISAGLGMYEPTYPIARMASEVGELEDAAKARPGKNALALWSRDNVFSWDEFETGVLPKLEEIRYAFSENEKGKAFIYRLVALLRSTSDPVSIPRLAYLLARSFEGDKEHGAETSRRFYAWATDDSERRYLTTALEIYVYSIRERG